MAVQNLIDRFTTTLASGYTSGGGSLSVTSASGLPTGGCSFLLIVLAETSNTEEVFLVTNVSGTTLTVTGAQANSSASNHASGATVIAGIITSAMLKQLCPVLIQERTASASATLDFDTTAGFGWYSSDFDEYEIHFNSLIPGTTGQVVWIRCSTDNGATYDAGNNYSSNIWAYRANGGGANGGTAQAQIALVIAQVTTSGWSYSSRLTLYNPGSASLFKQFSGKALGIDGTGRLAVEITGVYEVTTAVNGLRFMFASGTIASGTIRIYGIPK